MIRRGCRHRVNMYHELHWDTEKGGTKFDSASKFTFTIGGGEVIKGWDVGVKGMKVGGKRMLAVPAKLGYGKRGSPPEIPGDAVLCFEVKLLGIK